MDIQDTRSEVGWQRCRVHIGICTIRVILFTIAHVKTIVRSDDDEEEEDNTNSNSKDNKDNWFNNR